MSAERCTWCGVDVDADDGFRVAEAVGERRAAFCRLEHIVPWAIQGAHWEAGAISEPADLEAGLGYCSQCGAQVEETHVLAVRHRGERRIADVFCGVDHLLEWAKAGGRWR